MTEGKTEEAIIGFLKSLLEKGVVEDIMIPKAVPSQEGYVQTLIRDPRMFDGVCALAPTMPVQSARVISNLSVKNLGKRVGAVLKGVRDKGDCGVGKISPGQAGEPLPHRDRLSRDI